MFWNVYENCVWSEGNKINKVSNICSNLFGDHWSEPKNWTETKAQILIFFPAAFNRNVVRNLCFQEYIRWYYAILVPFRMRKK